MRDYPARLLGGAETIFGGKKKGLDDFFSEIIHNFGNFIYDFNFIIVNSTLG